ncbi:MAG: hypothetical protein VZQ81_09475 [Succiniclasticum sp.]|nr:hypothetical protein [Succiniclasticum sp.]
MDAFLTDETSCALLRMSRYSPELRLNECGARAVSISEGSSGQWWRGAVRAVSRYIDVDERHPLCILVPDHQLRVRTPLVKSTACAVTLPVGAFLSVELNGRSDDESGGGSLLAIESPAHSFARLAGALERAVHGGNLSRLQARALLIAYGYELCGTYARDARKPLAADAHYDLRPAATPDELAAWCRAQAGRGVSGIRLARSCARHVLAGSASPAESIHGIVFTTQPQLGGLGMSRHEVLMNESLKLSPEESRLMHRLPLTPDLTFTALGNRVIEHQGSYHDRPLQYQEDASRVQDYGALGRPVFMTSAADFASPERYDQFLRRFVAWVRHDMGPRVADHYQGILDDPAYAAARHELIAALTDHIHDPWHW